MESTGINVRITLATQLRRVGLSFDELVLQRFDELRYLGDIEVLWLLTWLQDRDLNARVSLRILAKDIESLDEDWFDISLGIWIEIFEKYQFYV